MANQQQEIGWQMNVPVAPPYYEEAPKNQIPSTTMIQPGQQVIISMQNPPVGPHPVRLCCPSCKNMIQTRVEHVASSKTHLIALLLCGIGAFCCVCCPYTIDKCQNAEHKCPNCGSYIGTFKN